MTTNKIYPQSNEEYKVAFNDRFKPSDTEEKNLQWAKEIKRQLDSAPHLGWEVGPNSKLQSWDKTNEVFSYFFEKLLETMFNTIQVFFLSEFERYKLTKRDDLYSALKEKMNDTVYQVNGSRVPSIRFLFALKNYFKNNEDTTFLKTLRKRLMLTIIPPLVEDQLGTPHTLSLIESLKTRNNYCDEALLQSEGYILLRESIFLRALNYTNTLMDIFVSNFPSYGPAKEFTFEDEGLEPDKEILYGPTLRGAKIISCTLENCVIYNSVLIRPQFPEW